MKKSIIAMMIISCLLIAIIQWGRSTSSLDMQLAPMPAQWSEGQMLWQRALAGAMPGLAADIAVLNVFNIYAQSQSVAASERHNWWQQLYVQLRTGQALDPWFRDIYRLSEGILAYEAKRFDLAVEILTMSSPYLNSADPLLAASFIAKQELNNNSLAIQLAKQATQKPDASSLTIGFASSLIQNTEGCKMAMLFLASRLQILPADYHQAILRRMQRLRDNDTCQQQ